MYSTLLEYAVLEEYFIGVEIIYMIYQQVWMLFSLVLSTDDCFCAFFLITVDIYQQ